MTQQYISGELSALLAQLQATTTDQPVAGDLARLRREAETWPPAALGPVAARALALSDDLCWEALAHLDATAFARQAALACDLHEFGVCSGLLEEP